MLKCDTMVAAFKGIKISLWCIKVHVITSAEVRMYKAKVNLGILLLWY